MGGIFISISLHWRWDYLVSDSGVSSPESNSNEFSAICDCRLVGFLVTKKETAST